MFSHKVMMMTDEQVEILRYQIAAYSTICQQLLGSHQKSIEAISSRHDDFTGITQGNVYSNSYPTMDKHRRRWRPSHAQLEVLERIYGDEKEVTPSKEKIKDIVSDLSQHGNISDMNVYNWFQNKRARSRKRQFMSQMEKRSESENSQVGTSEVSSGLQPTEPTPECGSSQISFYQSS